MNNLIRKQIQIYILDYLKKRIPNFEIKGKMFKCPCESRHQQKSDKLTANIFPENSYKVHCYDPACGKIGDIISLCREIDFCGNEDVDDDDICEFLKKEFKIQTEDITTQLFAKYSNFGWDLVPVAKNDKASNIEKEWQKKTHKDIKEWEQWYNSGLNLGVKTGNVSNIICIDFDLIESKLKKRIYEGNPTENMLQEAQEQYDSNLAKLKQLNYIDWETVQQKSFGGIHLFYIYDAEIPKTNLEVEGIHVDVLNDGGQVVIQPSIVGGFQREFSGEVIKQIPEELKKLIINNSSKKTESIEEIKEESSLPDEKLSFENLNNNRNNTFIKLGGELRKKMNVDQTSYAMYLFNQLLDKQLPQKELNAMTRQVEKYHVIDIDSVGTKILEHLRIVETAHIRDLRECLGFDRKDLEQSLKSLCDLKKIYKVKKDLYKTIKEPDWKEEFLSLGKPLDFKIPYFEDYAHLDNGNMIIIGASSGIGKTTLAMNFIKKFVEQGKQPYLISTEAGSKFQKIAQCVGLKEGDFKYIITNDPTSIELKDNAITIIDWLKAPESDYTKMDTIYEKLNDSLVQKNGLLIVFAQLRRGDKSFYSEDMTLFFGSLVAKLLYTSNNGVEDNSLPYFQTTKIRDSKQNIQYLTIPLRYDHTTRIIEPRKI